MSSPIDEPHHQAPIDWLTMPSAARILPDETVAKEDLEDFKLTQNKHNLLTFDVECAIL